MTLKGNFQFKIGATSYTIPADIVPNVEYLSGLIDDVEIILFQGDDQCPLPSEEIVEKLAKLSRDHALTYTIHCPLNLRLGHIDTATRKQSVLQCLRIIQRTNPLRPFGYIIHCQLEEGGEGGRDGAPWQWVDRVGRSIDELLLSGIEPFKLCLETLDYPYTFLSSLVMQKGLSYCLDIGHLIRCGFNVAETVTRTASQTRIVHLHGVENGKDHKNLTHFDKELLFQALRTLNDDSARQRVVTLEVFNEIDLKKSLSVLKRFAL